MGVLFGTDGVRGIANKDLTPELAYKLGKAGAFSLSNGKCGSNFILGRDTRISGGMLASALIAGMCSVGINVIDCGVLPTPAVAHLTKVTGASGGVMISASHNPFEDNGIKFFQSGGLKLEDEMQSEIENLVNDDCKTVPVVYGSSVGRIYDGGKYITHYIEYITNSVNADLSGLKIAIDCANGATSHVAEMVFRNLGANVSVFFNEPDGININAGCGSTHPEALSKIVVEDGYDAGLAYDGDGDRLIAIDEQGNILDGDYIMAICGLYMAQKGDLRNNTVVASIMSNMGLEIALKKQGISMLRTKVGDRYILEELLKGDYNFGGEQAGHIIFKDYMVTGDGIFTSLYLTSILARKGRHLSELGSVMEKLPQVLVNVKVSNKESYNKSDNFKKVLFEAEKKLRNTGRILVRPSGTEPIVRVMVEGVDVNEIQEIANAVANAMKSI